MQLLQLPRVVSFRKSLPTKAPAAMYATLPFTCIAYPVCGAVPAPFWGVLGV
jgi:hypothetical protein